MITMNEPHVSRETTPDDDGGDVLAAVRQLKVQLGFLHGKVDELLADSRAARPLLDRYLKTPAARWAGRAGRPK